jgi:hypothetical protein
VVLQYVLIDKVHTDLSRVQLKYNDTLCQFTFQYIVKVLLLRSTSNQQNSSNIIYSDDTTKYPLGPGAH